ncbi:4880_t:CDS:10, partial [Entrophospora sp. SA101]
MFTTKEYIPKPSNVVKHFLDKHTGKETSETLGFPVATVERTIQVYGKSEASIIAASDIKKSVNESTGLNVSVTTIYRSLHEIVSLCHLITFEDMISCSRAVQLCNKMIKSLIQNESLRNFVGRELLISALQALNDGHQKENHSLIIALITEIYLSLRPISSVPYETFGQILNLDHVKLQDFEASLVQGIDLKEQRNTVKKFLGGFTGVRKVTMTVKSSSSSHRTIIGDYIKPKLNVLDIIDDSNESTTGLKETISRIITIQSDFIWYRLIKLSQILEYGAAIEFKSYIVYSIFSISIFPILQYVFRESNLLTEVVPQLTYSIFMILICILGIRSHWRFTKLLRVTKNSTSTSATATASSSSSSSNKILMKNEKSLNPSKWIPKSYTASEEDCVKLKHSPSPWSSQQSRSANDVVNSSYYIDINDDSTVVNINGTPMAPKKSPRRPSIKTKTNDNNYIAEINVKDDVLSKLITTATTKTLSSKPYQQSPLNPKRSDKPESLKTSLPPITIRARSGSSSNVIESNNIRKSAINRNRSNSTNTLNNSNSTLIGGGTRRIPGSASSTKGNTGSRGGDGVKGINTLGRSRSSSNSSASSSGSILKKKVIKPTRDTVL